MIDQFRQSRLDMDAKLKDRCDWAMNSRTSRHIEGDEFLLDDAVTSNGFTLSNNANLHVTKVGKVTLETYIDDNISELHSPTITVRRHFRCNGPTCYISSHS